MLVPIRSCAHRHNLLQILLAHTHWFLTENDRTIGFLRLLQDLNLHLNILQLVVCRTNSRLHLFLKLVNTQLLPCQSPTFAVTCLIFPGRL